MEAMRWQLALPSLLLLASPNVVIASYLPVAGLHVHSPVALSWLAWSAPELRALIVYYPAPIVAGAVLFWRFGQANRVQRQQMRLLVWAIAVALVVLAIDLTAILAGVPPASPWLGVLGVLWLPLSVMIPASIVVGVLRHQLFGIEVVVRRSVIYGALSLGIAAIYIALAVAPGLALGTNPGWIGGGGHDRCRGRVRSHAQALGVGGGPVGLRGEDQPLSVARG